jgi:hypothetical protein
MVTAEPNADVITKELVHATTILIDARALRTGVCGVNVEGLSGPLETGRAFTLAYRVSRGDEVSGELGGYMVCRMVS